VVSQIERRVVAQTGRDLPEPAPLDLEPTAGRGSWREVFGRRYGGRTLMLSVFQFAQTIGVFGFTNWVAILLADRGYTIVSTLGYTFLIACAALITVCNNWLIGIFHTYGSELFPTRIRARGFGFTFSWSRVSSIFVSYWVADLLAAYGTAGVFTLIGAAMIVIIACVGSWGPTTNNLRLEELSP